MGEVERPRRLILTDTVFSMDGDLCPLPQIMALAEKYDATVFVDEAHATGVFGKKGRGVVEHFGIDSHHPRLIQMGTLGKALGSFGAYVCGPRELIDYLINRSRLFIYTTSLPPAVLGASLAAIELIEKDGSFRERLWENVKYFGEQLERMPACRGVLQYAPTESPIIPLIIGDAKKTMEIAEKLFKNGIWATGIRPPTVPEGTSRIRLTLMATHTREYLDRCLNALKEIL
ncbi:MAG: aminotransferase class I/II-fold pyridoxal phosphate-dependent enzyme [Deltaproteobacteria bacterium]|nr:aminotransferase class I/II-fold pyridoxal phosphate-dependent enzyme [Deltaproteobacteria bacterium]